MVLSEFKPEQTDEQNQAGEPKRTAPRPNESGILNQADSLVGVESIAMRIGYLIPQFPEQTHAFFWREVESLRAKGHYIRLISTRRPNTPCPHTFAKSAAAETLYLTPPRLGAVVGAAAHGLGVARHLWSLKETSPARRLIGTLWAPAAAQLVAACRADRLDHLHVHSCGNAAHVAALAHRWGGPPYSLSLHGDLPVYGRDHKQKMRNAAFVAVVTRALQRQTLSLIHI